MRAKSKDEEHTGMSGVADQSVKVALLKLEATTRATERGRGDGEPDIAFLASIQVAYRTISCLPCTGTMGLVEDGSQRHSSGALVRSGRGKHAIVAFARTRKPTDDMLVDGGRLCRLTDFHART